MAHPKRRSKNQMTEGTSVRILRENIPEAWVIRDYRPDYGIDAVVERFETAQGDPDLAETLSRFAIESIRAHRMASI